MKLLELETAGLPFESGVSYASPYIMEEPQADNKIADVDIKRMLTKRIVTTPFFSYCLHYKLDTAGVVKILAKLLLWGK
jgi:hypothetical protein